MLSGAPISSVPMASTVLAVGVRVADRSGLLMTVQDNGSGAAALVQDARRTVAVIVDDVSILPGA